MALIAMQDRQIVPTDIYEKFWGTAQGPDGTGGSNPKPTKYETKKLAKQKQNGKVISTNMRGGGIFFKASEAAAPASGKKRKKREKTSREDSQSAGGGMASYSEGSNRSAMASSTHSVHGLNTRQRRPPLVHRRSSDDPLVCCACGEQLKNLVDLDTCAICSGPTHLQECCKELKGLGEVCNGCWNLEGRFDVNTVTSERLAELKAGKDETLAAVLGTGLTRG